MTDRLMLLDTASLYFRAFYGVPDTIRRADGTPVNAVRGLLDMIARLTTDYGATHLVACWDDDWRPQWRVDLIPSYKSHRVAEEVAGAPDVEVVPDALEAQIPMIRRVLELAGIAVVGAADHEADDVIGTYASHAELPVDVVTGDRDLFQIVDDARQVRHEEPRSPDRRRRRRQVPCAARAVCRLRDPARRHLRRAARRHRHRREDCRVAAR
jgi:5'-3' exonuclease